MAFMRKGRRDGGDECEEQAGKAGARGEASFHIGFDWEEDVFPCSYPAPIAKPSSFLAISGQQSVTPVIFRHK